MELLSFWDLEEILGEDVVCIPSEDWLSDSIFSRDFDEYFWPLEFVRFEYLSNDRICEFVRRMSGSYIELNSRLLFKILNQLVCRVNISLFDCDMSHYSVGHSGLQIVPGSDPLDGIIDYLTRQCGGNVHEKDVVHITSSTPLNEESEHAAKNVADLKDDLQFFSDIFNEGRAISESPTNGI
jgi:hypothetical protein